MGITMGILTILPVLLLGLSVSAQDTVSSSSCQKVQALESITLNKLVRCEDLEESDHEDTGVSSGSEEEEALERMKRSGGETRAAVKEMVTGAGEAVSGATGQLASGAAEAAKIAGRATVKMAKGLVIAIVLAVTGWVSCLGVTCGVAIYHIMKKRRGIQG